MEGNYITVKQLIVKQEKFAQGSFSELRQRKDYTQSSDEVDWTLINELSIGGDGTFKLDNKGAIDMMIVKHFGGFMDQIELSGFNKLEASANVSADLPDADLKLIEMMMSNNITEPVVDIK
jgi:hypothetical protein